MQVTEQREIHHQSHFGDGERESDGSPDVIFGFNLLVPLWIEVMSAAVLIEFGLLLLPSLERDHANKSTHITYIVRCVKDTLLACPGQGLKKSL